MPSLFCPYFASHFNCYEYVLLGALVVETFCILKRSGCSYASVRSASTNVAKNAANVLNYISRNFNFNP